MDEWISWYHGYVGGYVLDEYTNDTQNKHDGDHGITWRGIIKCKSFTDMLFGVANAMVCSFSLPL